VRAVSWVLGLVVAIVLSLISFFIVSFPLQYSGNKGLPYLLSPAEKTMQTFTLNESYCNILCIKYKAGQNVDKTLLEKCEQKYNLGCYKPNIKPIVFAKPVKNKALYCHCYVYEPNTKPSCTSFYESVKSILEGNTISVLNVEERDCNEVCVNFLKTYCETNSGDCSMANQCVYVR